MEHSKHLWRAGILLGIAFLGGITARHFLIPSSFGEQGFYRYDSLKDYMAQEPVHGDSAACGVCHAEVFKARSEGHHATVSCEVCHAPMSVHAKDGVKTAEMPSNRSVNLCAYCHQQLKARPKSQAQVNIKQHMKTLGIELEHGEVPDGTCFTCHDVHSPQSVRTDQPAPPAATAPAALTPEPKPAPAAAAPTPDPAAAPAASPETAPVVPQPETKTPAEPAPQKSEGAA